MVFIDLDNFKNVNDSLGHESGDILLKVVADRLKVCVRPSDTVARLGGDEFTILLEDLSDDGQIIAVAERITEVLRSPIVIGEREVFMMASIGIAISYGNYSSSDALLRDADTAMYEAKASGKSRCIIFDQSMSTRAVERLELESDLRQALDNGELDVYYQPILHLESGKISEVEALVRWNHPTRGLVVPAEFIPLAEETGLIKPLGLWVLRESCRQVRDWQLRYPDEPLLTVSVNVSALQLQDDCFVSDIAQALQDTGISAKHLKLEITETNMIHGSDAIIPKLHQLKELGVRLAVDDFGTGYSSMAYLSSLPIDTLKIDRTFVSKMEQSDGAAIVSAIVTLAKMLNLRTTSEGIETAQQLSQLNTLGCDLGQGYYFAKPMTGEALEQMLLARRNEALPPNALEQRGAAEANSVQRAA